MTPQEETEMHALAASLKKLTRGTGWTAMQYAAIGAVMNKLQEYCAPEARTDKDRIVAMLKAWGQEYYLEDSDIHVKGDIVLWFNREGTLLGVMRN
jgi:hypothetical protein